MAKKEKSLVETSFIQALGLVAYISLVSTFFWKGNTWIPHLNNYLAPLIFLTLFSVSALICALIVLTQPFKLWQNGRLEDALKVLTYTAVWVLIFIVLLLGVILPRMF